MIEKKEFATVAFNLEDKVFVVYLTFINQDLDVHPSWIAQIALLKADKTPTSVYSEYINFINIFPKDLIVELSELIEINDLTINLIKIQ